MESIDDFRWKLLEESKLKKILNHKHRVFQCYTDNKFSLKSFCLFLDSQKYTEDGWWCVQFSQGVFILLNQSGLDKHLKFDSFIKKTEYPDRYWNDGTVTRLVIQNNLWLEEELKKSNEFQSIILQNALFTITRHAKFSDSGKQYNHWVDNNGFCILEVYTSRNVKIYSTFHARMVNVVPIEQKYNFIVDRTALILGCDGYEPRVSTMFPVNYFV